MDWAYARSHGFEGGGQGFLKAARTLERRVGE